MVPAVSAAEHQSTGAQLILQPHCPDPARRGRRPPPRPLHRMGSATWRTSVFGFLRHSWIPPRRRRGSSLRQSSPL